MDMISILVGAVAGAVVMWALAKWYYTKASAEDKARLKDIEKRIKAQGVILRE
jgi:uncharacterized membrane protein YdjX (TVP38/TMEM64 family)